MGLQLPMLPSRTYSGGSSADSVPGSRTRGRYAVVKAEGRYALYVPEAQMLFRLPEDIALHLQQALENPESPAYTESREFVSELILPHRRPLQNRDRSNYLLDLVVHPSQICNLDCKYCYAHELNQVNRVMTPDVADAVVARAMRMTGPEGLSSVKFLGGEPTIAWDIVERVVKAVQEAHRALPSGRMPAFVMVTNGTLINERMIDFAVANQMYVLISLDGPRAVHDDLRPTKNGKGSYDRAHDSLRRLLAAGADVAVESVYTKSHIDAGVTPLAMLNEFRSMGVRETHITIPLGTWHELHTIDAIDRTTALFVEAARASTRSFRTDDPFLLRGITSVLDGLLLAEDREFVCGAGRSYMAVNYDGEAFPCYLLESTQTSYGFVDGRWSDQRYDEISSKYRGNGKLFHAQCRDCWNAELCQLCQGYSFALDGRIAKSPVWFCRFIKEITAGVLGEVAAARESSDWDMFLDNMKSSLLNPQKPFVPAVRDPHRNATALTA